MAEIPRIPVKHFDLFGQIKTHKLLPWQQIFYTPPFSHLCAVCPKIKILISWNSEVQFGPPYWFWVTSWLSVPLFQMLLWCLCCFSMPQLISRFSCYFVLLIWFKVLTSSSWASAIVKALECCSLVVTPSKLDFNCYKRWSSNMQFGLPAIHTNWLWFWH